MRVYENTSLGLIRAAGAAALSGLVLCAGSAIAQQAETGGLQEIVVTAQKRTENAQQVPIAISAFSADMLQQKSITTVEQLSNLSPNVNLDAGTPFSGSDTVLSAYIRGVGQDDFAFNLDPGVGVYLDGVYLARSVGANTTMLDVDRVEILKGPQGTLFGRNSIGGAISIVTRDPGNEFKVKGEVTGGSFRRVDTRISMDVPFSEKLLSTFSFSEEKRDGYQRRIPYVQANAGGTGAGIPDCTTATCPYVVDAPEQFPAAGNKSGPTQGGIDKWSARGKFVALVNDDVKLTVMGDYLNVDQSAAANTVLQAQSPQLAPGSLGTVANLCLLGVTGPFNALCTSPRGGLSPTPTSMPVSTPLAGLNVDGNPYNNYLPWDSRFITNNIDTTYATGNNFSKLTNFGFGTVLDWNLDHAMKLKWINAYRAMHWDAGMDLDGSPEVYLQPSFDMIQHQLSEELQLNGIAVDDRLNYAVGAYFFKEGGHLHDFVPFPLGILQIDGPNDLDTRSEALYAHFNYKLTDHWSVTLGGRETKEHKEFNGYQSDDNGLTYKITGCNPPGLVPPTIFLAPGNPVNVNNLTCQQILGFPVTGQPYRYFPNGPFTQDFSNFSPTAGVDFHIDQDMMLYASFSKGYKTGSWTTRLSAPHPTYDKSLHFDPEFAKTYELGFKSELLDHRMRLNLAAFDTKYDNIQLNSQQGLSPTIVNAGDATIYGFEAELDALLGGGFSVTAGAGYTHAKYDSLNNVLDNGYLLTLNSCPERSPNAPIITGPTAASPAAIAASFKNGPCELPKTPKFKGSVGPQYVVDLPNSSAVQINLDWTYVTKEYNDIGNTYLLARPAMSQVNGVATYKAPGKAWEFALGGTNITNKRYLIDGQSQGALSEVYGTYNAPREWYATVRFNFAPGK